MKLNFIEKLSDISKSLIIVTDNKLTLPKNIDEIEKVAKMNIRDVLESHEYKGKHKEVLSVNTSSKVLSKVAFVGLGDIQEEGALHSSQAMAVGGKISSMLNCRKIKEVSLMFAVADLSKDQKYKIHSEILLGAMLKSYKFDKYFTKEDSKQVINTINVVSEDSKEYKAYFDEYHNLYKGVILTRDLVSEPPNVLNPELFAEKCKELKSQGVNVRILEEQEMQKLGMNALLGVAKGSRNKPKLVVMEWNGADNKNDQPIAFVGKGVTFDTGGLSLKPASYMVGMKYDMAGAGVVTGLMSTLSLRKAKVNAIGVIGLVENMPGGNAQRPEDIVKSMSGQTIEILNTDAEGRLVLADALWYTQEKYNPKFIIDLATLTGAIVVSLADQYAGVFSNDDSLCEQLYDAGIKVNEKVWRMPLSKEYDKMINSKIADMQNIGAERGAAGSITAAQFLQRFVNDVPWVHIDIAGVADSKKSGDLWQSGATGFGVRLLNQLVADYFETKHHS